MLKKHPQKNIQLVPIDFSPSTKPLEMVVVDASLDALSFTTNPLFEVMATLMFCFELVVNFVAIPSYRLLTWIRNGSVSCHSGVDEYQLDFGS